MKKSNQQSVAIILSFLVESMQECRTGQLRTRYISLSNFTCNFLINKQIASTSCSRYDNLPAESPVSDSKECLSVNSKNRRRDAEVVAEYKLVTDSYFYCHVECSILAAPVLTLTILCPQ